MVTMVRDTVKAPNAPVKAPNGFHKCTQALKVFFYSMDLCHS